MPSELLDRRDGADPAHRNLASVVRAIHTIVDLAASSRRPDRSSLILTACANVALGGYGIMELGV